MKENFSEESIKKATLAAGAAANTAYYATDAYNNKKEHTLKLMEKGLEILTPLLIKFIKELENEKETFN